MAGSAPAGGWGWGGRFFPRIAVTAPFQVCSAWPRMRWRMVLRFLALSSLMNSAALAACEASAIGGCDGSKGRGAVNV